MPSTTAYNPGDIVLVRFPFTDLTSHKQRPAVVVSPQSFSAASGDFVVLALTSQPQSDNSLRLDDWRSSGLVKPTWVKPLVGTIARQLLVRRLGVLTINDQNAVRVALDQLIASDFRP